MARDIGCRHFLSVGFLRKIELGCLVTDQGEVSITTSTEVDSLFLTAIELEVGSELLALAFGGYDLHKLHLHSREILSI